MSQPTEIVLPTLTPNGRMHGCPRCNRAIFHQPWCPLLRWLPWGPR